MSKEEEAKKRVFEVWQSLPEEVKEELFEALEESSAQTPEEFYIEIMVGGCPQCGSNHTQNCERIVGIEDTCVGFCLDCGYLWCLECRLPLTSGTNCEHWIFATIVRIVGKKGVRFLPANARQYKTGSKIRILTLVKTEERKRTLS